MHVKFELPEFDIAFAQQMAKEVYDLNCTARSLPSERDRNFHLEATDGNQFVLKISNASEERGVLELQNCALEHVAAHAAELRIPRLCATAEDGALIAEVSDREGRRHFVRMLTFIPAQLMANIRPHSAELLRSLGIALAKLDRALLDFSHPAAARKLKWDLTQAIWISEYIEAIDTKEERSIVNRFLHLFETTAAPEIPNLRRSVTYNDANDYNILVDSSMRVIGFIDFGDMLESIVIGDLAVALAYAMLHKDDPLLAARHVVSGYQEIFPIDQTELKVLLPLACARLCITVVNAAYQRKVDPDNSYLTISEKPAWQTLRKLSSIEKLQI